MRHQSTDPRVRFWSKVATGDGCWEWQGARMSTGYGVFAIERKPFLAHRLSWMWANGPIVDGLFICHHCDNPPCVRPDHLFVGKQIENMADMNAKGRRRGGGRKGESATGACRPILTAAMVRTIRDEYGTSQFSLSQLAVRYGVSKSAIHAIVRGHNWRHVDASF